MLITTQPLPDLLLDAQIGRWAVPRGTHRWQLTQESVTAAVKTGLALAELLKLLADRLIHPVPRLLDVALRAWAGERSAVNLADIIVLQCAQPAIFDAIVKSAKLRRFCAASSRPIWPWSMRRSWKSCGSNCAGLAWRFPPNSAVKQSRR